MLDGMLDGAAPFIQQGSQQLQQNSNPQIIPAGPTGAPVSPENCDGCRRQHFLHRCCWGCFDNLLVKAAAVWIVYEAFDEDNASSAFCHGKLTRAECKTAKQTRHPTFCTTFFRSEI